MLHEISPTRQVPDEPLRKWFVGDELDLIVWFDSSEGIIGFQLCYLKGTDEHALTWWKDKGYSHDRIDDGEGRPDDLKMTPILVPDGSFDKENVIALFRENSGAIDPQLVEFVTKTIGSYPG